MKRTRFDVEMDIDNIAREVADQYGVESDFYGDCYPDAISLLENRLEQAKTDDEYDELLEEVVEEFKRYVR